MKRSCVRVGSTKLAGSPLPLAQICSVVQTAWFGVTDAIVFVHRPTCERSPFGFVRVTG